MTLVHTLVRLVQFLRRLSSLVVSDSETLVGILVRGMFLFYGQIYAAYPLELTPDLVPLARVTIAVLMVRVTL